jgi:hypothetical protein
MKPNLAPHYPSGPDQAAPSDPFTRGLRIASQVTGLILVLAGAYYAVSILAAAIGFARNPGALEPALTAMAQTLNLTEATVSVGEDRVSLGRTVSAGFVLMWYLLSGWLAYLVMSAGGRLVLGVIGERREFLAAMREFLVSMRAQGAEQSSHKST